MGEMEYNVRVVKRELFLRSALVMARIDPHDAHAGRIFFTRIHLELCREWRQALHDGGAPELITDIEQSQVADLLEGNHAVVYYVAA
jgi:hypothetical protein